MQHLIQQTYFFLHFGPDLFWNLLSFKINGKSSEERQFTDPNMDVCVTLL